MTKYDYSKLENRFFTTRKDEDLQALGQWYGTFGIYYYSFSERVYHGSRDGKEYIIKPIYATKVDKRGNEYPDLSKVVRFEFIG